MTTGLKLGLVPKGGILSSVRRHATGDLSFSFRYRFRAWDRSLIGPISLVFREEPLPDAFALDGL